MGVLFFIIFGFVVGLIARALMPGRQPLGFVLTTVLGIAGSFLGGSLASLFTHQRVMDLHTAGIVGSVIGALVLLAVGGFVTGRGTRHAI